MATYNLNYRNEQDYELVLDVSVRDININRLLVGNTKTWTIRNFGPDLIVDELIVQFQTQTLDASDKSLLSNDSQFISDRLSIEYCVVSSFLFPTNILVTGL